MKKSETPWFFSLQYQETSDAGNCKDDVVLRRVMRTMLRCTAVRVGARMRRWPQVLVFFVLLFVMISVLPKSYQQDIPLEQKLTVDLSENARRDAKPNKDKEAFVYENLNGKIETYKIPLESNVKAFGNNLSQFSRNQQAPAHSLPDFIVANDLEEVSDDEIGKDSALSPRECVGDCARLQKMMQMWPPSKPTAAFYFLTQKHRIEKLKKSLQLIDENFNDKYHYPVIIFHESDFVSSLHDEVRSSTRSAVFFQEITFNQPDFLTKRVQFNIPCLSTISYRKMCRFHAKEIYEYPIIHLFDYLFRLDDDSFITRPIRYDVFEFMKAKDIMYGYIWPHYDAMSCTEGLWEATGHFINVTGIVPHFFHEWVRPKLYYNNFEISRTDLWLSDHYTSYVNYLDRLGGMFYHRWGDAPIKSLAVTMLVPKNKTHLFKDIGYHHNSFEN